MMCDDWRAAMGAPSRKPIILLLPDGEICGGERDDQGAFWRTHGGKEQVFPECWASMPAASETHSRLRYAPRSA